MKTMARTALRGAARVGRVPHPGFSGAGESLKPASKRGLPRAARQRAADRIEAAPGPRRPAQVGAVGFPLSKERSPFFGDGSLAVSCPFERPLDGEAHYATDVRDAPRQLDDEFLLGSLRVPVRLQ